MAVEEQRREFRAAIRQSGYRLTGPRAALAEVIEHRRGHFTAAELLADARASGLRVGRATIFRALELFAELGVLERVDLPNGEHAYVACAPEEHHHHVLCARCGRSVAVADHGLQSVMADIGRRTGFEIDGHRLELFGTCPRCRAAAA